MKPHSSIGGRWLMFLVITIMIVGANAYAQQQGQTPAPPPPQDKKADEPCMVQSEQAQPDGHNVPGRHAGHLDLINARGEQAMGFSQTQTTHHFLLRPDGGVIQVEVNDATDTESRAEIRQHLAHIAKLFAAGNFDTPMLVHAQTLPGVPTMKRLRAAIKFVYEETAQGGRVRLATKDAEALAAVHEFLRFQIKDHGTGDPLVVGK